MFPASNDWWFQPWGVHPRGAPSRRPARVILGRHPPTIGEIFHTTPPPPLSPVHSLSGSRSIGSRAPARGTAVVAFVAAAIAHHDRSAIGAARSIRLRTEPQRTDDRCAAGLMLDQRRLCLECRP